MDINAVFDTLFKDHPKAKEGKTLGKKPSTTLSWVKADNKTYVATGPRGGTIRVRYNEKSNKITIGYVD